MSYSEKWQAARDARRARRGTDPTVQARAQQYAVEKAKRARQEEAAA